MTSQSPEMGTLAERCARAAEAYERVLNMPEGRPVSMEAMATAAGLVLSMHGSLFAECAAALSKARGETP